eukprot:ANDGO_01052.mRNA.1 hypothetical protein
MQSSAVSISPSIDSLVSAGDDALRVKGFDPAYIHSIRYASWGRKKGGKGLVKAFKRRFFVLIGAVRIDYHDTDPKVSQLDTRTTKRGTIALVPQSLVQLDDERENTITITRARPEMDRQYIITFDDESTTKKWILLLRNRLYHWAQIAMESPTSNFKLEKIMSFKHPSIMEFQRTKANRVEVYVIDCGLSATLVIDKVPYSMSTHEKYANAAFGAAREAEPEWRKLKEEMRLGGLRQLPYCSILASFDKEVGDIRVCIRSRTVCHVTKPVGDFFRRQKQGTSQDLVYMGYQLSMSSIFESQEQWDLYELLFDQILGSLCWCTDDEELNVVQNATSDS